MYISCISDVRRIHVLVFLSYSFYFFSFFFMQVYSMELFTLGGLPLNVTTLPQKLKEAGKNLDWDSRIYIL